MHPYKYILAMKKLLSLAACALFALLSVSCIEDIFDPSDPYGDNDNTFGILDGNTLNYGDHTYILDEKGNTGTITFTHFPKNVREFRILQNQLLGYSKAGVLALDLMAMEMYRRNRTAGSAALAECNVSSKLKSIMNQLNLKFPEDREAGETDTSYQPYLIASFLQGATFENGYQPDYPYVLKFYENPSPFVKQGESSYLGKLYHWCIMRYGEKEVDATIAYLDDDEPYIVTECSDFTAGVPAVKFWEDTLQ